MPRIELKLRNVAKTDKYRLEKRKNNEFSLLFSNLYPLYGHRADFFYQIEELLYTAIDYHSKRPADLKTLDEKRIDNPDWYKDHNIVGAMAYADLFAGDLKGVEKRIPYLKKLNINYFHLMPFFDCPEGENDGGYAVSDYRSVREDLGTLDDLKSLTKSLREEGISFVADFVFNHTSNEHTWAKKALAREEKYQDYYYMFPDRTIPDQYDSTLREIFPDTRRGNFTWVDEIQKWVWTTFHNYQWDLNYQNPDLFREIAGEMLFLANIGVEVLRLDAIAFTGKILGTSSENQPEAHMLVKALNAITNIAAPAVVFKSEAIVHPDYVNSYISKEECELSYNPLLMALMWEALATRDVKLLQHSMKNRFQIPDDTAWVNYVRSHDDIGWTFSDEDAAELGINGNDHRRFLNQFYAGEFAGSFSCGEAFQHNPDTGDMRICGMAASLTGLEKGLDENDPEECELAIKRMTLMYAVSMFIGGIPLIYLGDEMALTNDYGYRDEPHKKRDSRWVHRIKLNDSTFKKIEKESSFNRRMFQNMQKMIKIRSSDKLFGLRETEFPVISNKHLFSFTRQNEQNKLHFIGNFSEHKLEQSVAELCPNSWSGNRVNDLWGDDEVFLNKKLNIQPYQIYLLIN